MEVSERNSYIHGYHHYKRCDYWRRGLNVNGNSRESDNESDRYHTVKIFEREKTLANLANHNNSPTFFHQFSCFAI